MPGRRIIVETDSHGYPVKVVRRHSHHDSHHNNHHHHLPHLPHLHWDDRHHHHPTEEDLSSLRDRNHALTEANEVLYRENASLKTNLHSAESDLRHSRATITSLQSNVRSLAVENGDLRRALEAHQGCDKSYQALKDSYQTLAASYTTVKESERLLKAKNTRLENDNSILIDRIKVLGREVKEAVDEKVKSLKEELGVWMRRYEDLDRRYRRMRVNLDDYIRRNDDLRVENAALRRANTLLERRLARHRLL